MKVSTEGLNSVQRRRADEAERLNVALPEWEHATDNIATISTMPRTGSRMLPSSAKVTSEVSTVLRPKL